jgi:hypothetical protein
MAPLPRPAHGRTDRLNPAGRREARHVTNRDCSTGRLGGPTRSRLMVNLGISPHGNGVDDAGPRAVRFIHGKTQEQRSPDVERHFVRLASARRKVIMPAVGVYPKLNRARSPRVQVTESSGRREGRILSADVIFDGIALAVARIALAEAMEDATPECLSIYGLAAYFVSSVDRCQIKQVVGFGRRAALTTSASRCSLWATTPEPEWAVP